MAIFKIFKVMENSQFNQASYQNLFELLNKIHGKKSDNMLLLLASIKKKIAENYKITKNIPLAIQCL